MKSQLLANPRLNFIIFGGKGGTGKTTCSCATALYLGQKYKNHAPEPRRRRSSLRGGQVRSGAGKKILVVSTDPAPSVGDSFDVEVGNKVTQIKDNIFAQELNAKELIKDFRKKNLKAIQTIAERGTYLDREDIEQFTSLSTPGMDEVMAIIKISELLKEKEYDLIILDTAPTGHTKVLLSLPKAMRRWLKVADLMLAKHRFLARTIRGKYRKDECDKFIEDTLADIKMVEEFLKDFERTEFVPVTIPEPMSILETEVLIHDLEDMDIPVKNIICNRVPMTNKCPFCRLRAKEKEKYMAMIEEKFKDYNLLKMPLFPREVRGKDCLSEYAKILFGEKQFEIRLPEKLPTFPEIPLPAQVFQGKTWAGKGKMADFLKKDLDFIICGGKGGVGKTSLAAATAIALAKKHKEKKVLITTTDPAHALSNIFDQDIPLGEKPVPIGKMKNLDGLEINAQKLLQDFKDEYKADMTAVIDRFVGKSMDIVFDRKVMEELMDLSPPGLEELMALGKIMDLMNPHTNNSGVGVKEQRYDIYVLDSAASGHLLRFLELPGLVREWLKNIFRVLLKYRGIARITEIEKNLIDFSKNVRKIQETVFGSKKTEFIMLGIAEEMGIREMGDLSKSLEKLNINFNYILMNYIVPPSRCNFCLAKRQDQEKYIKLVEKQYRSKKMILIPLLPHDIRGIDSLNKFSKILYGI